MKIQTIENRMPELIGVLTQVWEDSVRATHNFLMPGDVERIKEYVPQAIGGIGKLAVAFNEQDRPVDVYKRQMADNTSFWNIPWVPSARGPHAWGWTPSSRIA